MYCKLTITIFICTSFANAAVLIWSNKDFTVSPLQPFGNEDLDGLKEKLNISQVFVFKSFDATIPDEFGSLVKGYKTAFNPNGNINMDSDIELLGDNELDKIKIKENLELLDDNEDFIAVLEVANKRIKREAENATNEPEFKPSETQVEYTKPEGSVMYIGISKKDLYTIMYSAKPLLLKIKDEKIYLGSTSQDMITVDTRLNVNIPIEKGEKVSLRFSFMTKNGYWSLTSVKITDTRDQMNFNLTANSNIMAAAQFSYHCSGETVFSDKSNNIELIIYNLQVQIDSRNGKFSDANDCVPFTTAPIWSGLFVTSLLGIGLIIALTAIMDIKTMDKFDNQKTKNLSITVID